VTINNPLKIGSSCRVAFSPDGTHLAAIAGGLSGKVSVWNLEAGKCLFRVRPLSYLARMEFSPCGRRLVLKNTVGQIVVVDASSGRTLCDFDNAGEPGVSDGTHPLFSACGQLLVDSTGRELRVHNVNSGEIVFQKSYVEAGELIRSVVRLHGGTKWLLAHIAKFDAATGEEGEDYVTEWTWPFDRATPHRVSLDDTTGLRDILATDTGRYLALRVWGGLNLHVYSIDNLDHVFAASVPAAAHLRWSSNGRYLAAVDAGEVAIYAADDFQIVTRHSFKELNDFAFSPRGDCVVFGARNGVVAPWSDVLGKV
jgi:WD40 repeat protein